MSLRDKIQRFLDDVDPKILERGKDYCRSGMVKCLDNNCGYVTAEVSGSEKDPYFTEIDLAEDGEVVGWSCGCPYDWGPVCKHVVAVLLVLQKSGLKNMQERAPKDPAKRKAAVQKLVEQAGKEQLVALVLEHCWEDKRFQSQVLSVLEDTGEQELDSIRELVEEALRANVHHGGIDMGGIDNICADLDDALDKARCRMQRGQWDCGLEITQFVLLTSMKLAGEADSGSGSLRWTVEAALETAGLAAAGLAESGGDREKWVKRLLETAQEPLFDAWPSWRYDLLCRTAVLADSQNEGAFYDALAQLSDRRWQSFRDAPRYDDQDKLVRWHVIRYAHGTQKARAYLQRNLAVDAFRLLLAREYMDEGDYAAAERLCRERIEQEDQERSWYKPSQWQYLLYEIERDGGKREEQIQQARRLALMGDRVFYQTTKALLSEEGRWTEAYPQFLAELKAKRPAREYMEILAQENETALLMDQVRYHRDEVFHYGGVLAPLYGKEIYSLCANAIREIAKRMQNRKDYKRTCGLLQLLAEFGGTAEARVLMAELRQAYPNRPALRKELEQVEQRMAGRSKPT